MPWNIFCLGNTEAEAVQVPRQLRADRPLPDSPEELDLSVRDPRFHAANQPDGLVNAYPINFHQHRPKNGRHVDRPELSTEAK